MRGEPGAAGPPRRPGRTSAKAGEPATPSAIAPATVTLTQDMLTGQPPSNGHKLTILSAAFHHIGIAVTRDSSGTVWMTQDLPSEAGALISRR